MAAIVAAAVGCSGKGNGTAQASTDSTAAAPEDADKGKDKDEKGGQKEVAVPVEVAPLASGEIQAVLRATANLEAESEVKVYSQAARLVQELRVEEGDRVRKGDLLLRLQDDEQRSALAKVQSQHDKTAREYERQKQLHANQLISDEQFHNATYELDQLRIALEDARRALSYTEVRAPIGGTITARLIKIGDQVTVGQHLFDLVDFDSIVARIYVPEKDLPQLRPGVPAHVVARGAGDAVHRGSVRRIAPAVDPRTGTVKVTVGLDERDGLRPGMYVDVSLLTQVHRGVLLIPKRALVRDKDLVFVYRLGDERRVSKVAFDPILEDRDFVEPASGFAAGDQIVIAGQAGLKDGALVRLPGDPEEEPDGSEAAVASAGSR